MPDIEGFRAAFPAFIDTGVYSDARVQFWLNLALKLLNRARWGNLYDEGVYLFSAHGLTMEHRSLTFGDAGGSGAVTSESQSIGNMSYSQSYDASAYSGGGQMSSTIYGQQYLDLVRIIGAGGTQCPLGVTVTGAGGVQL
ncbi:MAG: DUF4054 domain-containing protein [Clostridiales Family XIII bacterium]|jgi:hypothetical protein|nr:DUF4054 domain-containing protein [Clostridiales Family XIII bacterium]